jgi:hypothetical protein
LVRKRTIALREFRAPSRLAKADSFVIFNRARSRLQWFGGKARIDGL